MYTIYLIVPYKTRYFLKTKLFLFAIINYQVNYVLVWLGTTTISK